VAVTREETAYDPFLFRRTVYDEETQRDGAFQHHVDIIDLYGKIRDRCNRHTVAHDAHTYPCPKNRRIGKDQAETHHHNEAEQVAIEALCRRRITGGDIGDDAAHGHQYSPSLMSGV